MTPQEFNTLISAILGIVAVCTAIFGICMWIIRTKDLQALKPQIDKLPLIEQSMAEMNKDIGEIKGTLNVIPAMAASTNHNTEDIKELRERVLAIERSK